MHILGFDSVRVPNQNKVGQEVGVANDNQQSIETWGEVNLEHS